MTSSPNRPVKWVPTGRLSSFQNNGSDMPGCPVMLQSGGEWISYLDLENLMSQHEAVLEPAAISIPDEKWGERPLMIITLKPDYQGKVTPEELKQFLKQFAAEGKIPKYGIPEQYVFTDSIPKTSVGKLAKKVLRKDYNK